MTSLESDGERRLSVWDADADLGARILPAI